MALKITFQKKNLLWICCTVWISCCYQSIYFVSLCKVLPSLYSNVVKSVDGEDLGHEWFSACYVNTTGGGTVGRTTDFGWASLLLNKIRIENSCILSFLLFCFYIFFVDPSALLGLIFIRWQLGTVLSVLLPHCDIKDYQSVIVEGDGRTLTSGTEV